MFQFKNKNQLIGFFLFIIVGLGISISTYLEYGFNKEGLFGWVAGVLAISYAFFRSKIVNRK